ncbi:hypothetical protein OG927_31590 [Streptomyces clavifer]|uniref:hypothetical protein n=1 Tax=Streptomyces clavifer TaxID=68188 RepID=UPI002E810305|nr:hypothetical protein [Streptomyces clavifer]WUC31612.1 hypothetical protein OG927_31590 [Streptomyces clavifer]
MSDEQRQRLEDMREERELAVTRAWNQRPYGGHTDQELTRLLATDPVDARREERAAAAADEAKAALLQEIEDAAAGGSTLGGSRSHPSTRYWTTPSEETSSDCPATPNAGVARARSRSLASSVRSWVPQRRPSMGCGRAAGEVFIAFRCAGVAAIALLRPRVRTGSSFIGLSASRARLRGLLEDFDAVPAGGDRDAGDAAGDGAGRGLRHLVEPDDEGDQGALGDRGQRQRVAGPPGEPAVELGPELPVAGKEARVFCGRASTRCSTALWSSAASAAAGRAVVRRDVPGGLRLVGRQQLRLDDVGVLRFRGHPASLSVTGGHDRITAPDIASCPSRFTGILSGLTTAGSSDCRAQGWHRQR